MNDHMNVHESSEADPIGKDDRALTIGSFRIPIFTGMTDNLFVGARHAEPLLMRIDKKG